MDMFYSYDNEITPTKPALPAIKNVRPLFDIRNRQIGVEGKYNSTFSLFFHILGVNADIAQLLNEGDFIFEILDRKENVIFTAEPFYHLSKNTVEVSITANEITKLTYGKYTMHLYLLVGEEKFDIFNRNDGILQIK